MHLKIGPQKKIFNGRHKQTENETQHQQQTITTSKTSTESKQTKTLITLQDILHKLVSGLDRLENKLDNLINKVKEPKNELLNVPKPAKAQINKTVSVANPKITNQCQFRQLQERAEILENKGHQINEKLSTCLSVKNHS